MNQIQTRFRQLSILVALFVLAAIAAAPPLQAQNVDQFISDVENAVSALTTGIGPAKQPIVFGGQNIYAYGFLPAALPADLIVDYTDGLKASGVQRLEFNPAVTTINNTTAAANLDAMVRRLRQLGMQLAINPEYDNNEFPVTTFQDFVNVALQTYPALAARYQADNFVIVHEPTTFAARMGFSISTSDWISFIQQVEPLIKAASPRTRVGAGDCTHCNEDAYFQAFATMPTCSADTVKSGCLDFVTMDIYSYSINDFDEAEMWAETAHSNNKGVYIEETFAPHFLAPGTTLGSFQGSPTGAEGASLIGAANVVFESLDQLWLQGMADFASSYGMESITAFTTQTFFLYVSSGVDKATDPTYLHELESVLQQGQLTDTGQAYAQDVQQLGKPQVTSISNASYATLASIYNPSCGGSGKPCYPNSTVAPDMLVSAFGAKLATGATSSSDFPTTLGGTKATLLDSQGNSYDVPLYSVAPTQVNYIVPSKAASGPATLTITSGDGTQTSGIVLVSPVSPGLYTGRADGSGSAAAIAVCEGTCSGWTHKIENGPFWGYTSIPGCSSDNCAAPITWGANDTLIIELFGTGIRHRSSLSTVTASVKGQNLQVQYAGPQGDPGLDQINVLIPRSLSGAGQVTLTVTIQDTQNNIPATANTVTLDLE